MPKRKKRRNKEKKPQIPNGNEATKPLQCNKSVGIKTGCVYIHRIITGLKYYLSLDELTNSVNQKQLSQYCSEEYCSLLNDYIHVMRDHSDDLDEIYAFMSEDCNLHCNVNECALLRRHHRNRQITHSACEDSLFMFYQDIFDSLHCYLLHSFDMGLRIKKQTVNTLGDMKCGENSFDHHKQELKSTDAELAEDMRFKKNNKFTLKCHQKLKQNSGL